MNESVKKELQKNIQEINKNFDFILNEKLPTEELIKLEFEGIRILVDYCERLALNGEEAIEKL